MPKQEHGPRLEVVEEALADMKPIDAETVGKIIEGAVSLIIARWKQICSVAHEEDAGGQVSFSVNTRMDFRSIVPCGKQTLSFSAKVSDTSDFVCEDPNQPKLLDAPSRKKGKA